MVRLENLSPLGPYLIFSFDYVKICRADACDDLSSVVPAAEKHL